PVLLYRPKSKYWSAFQPDRSALSPFRNSPKNRDRYDPVRHSRWLYTCVAFLKTTIFGGFQKLYNIA
ncbi:MAG TPA: hypothetical protein PKC25_14035, partial [Candidatus Rifleibacterium sp.]|nr:hypothetical protein [Candidatus Rifleibacterium sp.]